MSIPKFLMRRILYLIPTIFLVTLAVFSILQLIPGDPVDALLGYEQNQDYVQAHRSQGLSEPEIVGIYTLKNALIPTVTIASIRFAMLLGGTVIIESVFAWPGIGLMILDGILSKDYPVVQGGILVLSFSFIFINLAVDIIYKWLGGFSGAYGNFSCCCQNRAWPWSGSLSFFWSFLRLLLHHGWQLTIP